MVLSCGEAEEGKAGTCDSDWRGEVAGKEGDCAVSKPRKRCMYFKNDKLADQIEGYFEAEKDDWNISIGFGNMRFACGHCKRRFSAVVGAEARLQGPE